MNHKFCSGKNNKKISAEEHVEKAQIMDLDFLHTK